MVEFDKKVEQLIKKTEKNNNWRQRECINLIPSESTPSLWSECVQSQMLPVDTPSTA